MDDRPAGRAGILIPKGMSPEDAGPSNSATATALVEAHELSRTFQHQATVVMAVIGATFRVGPRERIAIVGASASGKSTLLHLIGGLDTPTSGVICWPALGPRDGLRPRHVGVVFQMPSLLAPLTAVENVELPLLLSKVPPQESRQIALDTLERIDLRAIADKLPEELSSGQAQRVAVARVLCYRPKLILADEPTGQLDHPTAHRLFDVLLGALAGTDVTLIVATHDLAIAERLSRVWHMDHGVLDQGP